MVLDVQVEDVLVFRQAVLGLAGLQGSISIDFQTLLEMDIRTLLMYRVTIQLVQNLPLTLT